MSNSKTSRNNPVSGAIFFLRGLSLIFNKGVKRYVAIPLLINTSLFAGAVYYGWNYLDTLTNKAEAWLPDILSFLSWLLIPLFIVTVALVVFFGFVIIGNLIAAPFNGLLSEAVEKNITGVSMDSGGGWGRLITGLLRSLYSEVRKLLYFLLWLIPLLILFFIPGLNLAAPFLWLIFSTWMLVIEYADFPMGNHDITFPHQRKILAGKRLLSLGFGAAVTLALMIPVVNFLVIPAAVAGATAMWVEQLSSAKDISSQ